MRSSNNGTPRPQGEESTTKAAAGSFDFIRTPTKAPAWLTRPARAQAAGDEANLEASPLTSSVPPPEASLRAPPTPTPMQPNQAPPLTRDSPSPIRRGTSAAALSSPPRTAVTLFPFLDASGAQPKPHQTAAPTQSSVQPLALYTGLNSTVHTTAMLANQSLARAGPPPETVSLRLPSPSIIARASSCSPPRPHPFSRQSGSSSGGGTSCGAVGMSAAALFDTNHMRALESVVLSAAQPIATSDPFALFAAAEGDRREARAMAAQITGGAGIGVPTLPLGNAGGAESGDGSHPFCSTEEARGLMPCTALAAAMFRSYQARSYTAYPCCMCGATVAADAMPLHHSQCAQGINATLLALRRHPLCGPLAHPAAAAAHLLGCRFVATASSHSSSVVNGANTSADAIGFYEAVADGGGGPFVPTGNVPPASAPMPERRAYANAAAVAFSRFAAHCRGCGEAWPIDEASDHFDVCCGGGVAADATANRLDGVGGPDATRLGFGVGQAAAGSFTGAASPPPNAARAKPHLRGPSPHRATAAVSPSRALSPSFVGRRKESKAEEEKAAAAYDGSAVAHAVAMTVAAAGGGYRGYPIVPAADAEDNEAFSALLSQFTSYAREASGYATLPPPPAADGVGASQQQQQGNGGRLRRGTPTRGGGGGSRAHTPSHAPSPLRLRANDADRSSSLYMETRLSRVSDLVPSQQRAPMAEVAGRPMTVLVADGSGGHASPYMYGGNADGSARLLREYNTPLTTVHPFSRYSRTSSAAAVPSGRSASAFGGSRRGSPFSRNPTVLSKAEQ